MKEPLIISMVNPKELKPWKDNPKNHTPEQIDRLVNSINRFGWTQPIVAGDDGTIIIGHGRHQAALKMELKEVPVLFRKNWSKEQQAVVAVFDNTSCRETGFDTQKMRTIYDEISQQSGEFDLPEWGLEWETLGEQETGRDQDVDTTKEKHDAYLTAEIKQIVFYFEAGEFGDVAKRTYMAMKDRELDNKGDLLMELLEDYGVGVD